MHFDLIKIFHEMDWMARGVTFALLLMGVASLAVAVERLVAFARSRLQSADFSSKAGAHIADRNYEKLLAEAEMRKASYLTRMLVPALKVYLAHEWQAMDKPAAVVELVRREITRRQEEVGSDVRRGFGVLASVGSVAPFVGLLGTVVGIIAAFAKISTTGSSGLGAVAGGISEALVVTALGLLIAIPAVLIFNALSNKADKIQQGLAASAGELIDHLEFSQQLLEAREVVARRNHEHEHVDGNGNGTQIVATVS
jgi:biopolymer transport protein ExbB